MILSQIIKNVLYNKSLLIENSYNLQCWRKMSNWIKNLIKKNDQKKEKNKQKDKNISNLICLITLFLAFICTLLSFASKGNDASMFIALFTSSLTISFEVVAWRNLKVTSNKYINTRTWYYNILDKCTKNEWYFFICFFAIGEVLYLILYYPLKFKDIDSRIPNILTMIVIFAYLISNMIRERKFN